MALSNIYEAGAVEIFELFGDYLDGSAERICLVVSQNGLGPKAASALDKSLVAFGYGPDACSHATLLPQDANVEGGDIPLDPRAFFFLVEGIDPLFLICADTASVNLAAEAYRMPAQPDSATRIFGRPAVMFENLDTLMESEAGKQKAWKLLKSLPHRL